MTFFSTDFPIEELADDLFLLLLDALRAIFGF